MIEQIGVALPYTAFYSTAGIGTTGLTVTVDVYRNGTEIVTAGACTDAGDGLYTYTLAAGSNTVEGVYIAVFKTATTTVDQQHIVAGWYVGKAGVENLDAAVSTRATPADVTVTASVAVTAANAATLATGNVAFTSYAHNSQVITSTSTEDLASATKVWFALKDLYSETDAQSLIFIEKTAGLTHVGKSAIVSPIVTTDGSLTVGGSSGAWTFTVVLKSEAAALLAEYAGSRKLGEIKATIGGLDKVIGTVTGAINSGVIRTNA